MKLFILDQSDQKEYQSNEKTKPELKTPSILSIYIPNNNFNFFSEEPNKPIKEKTLNPKAEIIMNHDVEGLFYSFSFALNVFFLMIRKIRRKR